MSIEKKMFTTTEDFVEYFLPEHCAKYPITMRVNKEEQKLIRQRQGDYLTDPSKQVKWWV